MRLERSLDTTILCTWEPLLALSRAVATYAETHDGELRDFAEGLAEDAEWLRDTGRADNRWWIEIVDPPIAEGRKVWHFAGLDDKDVESFERRRRRGQIRADWWLTPPRG
jgi:hypothetical protein